MLTSDLLHPQDVVLRCKAETLQQAIRILEQRIEASGILSDAGVFAADVQARADLGGLCVGRGLAIPHAKSAAVQKVGLAALTLDPPLACETPDDKPVRMMFLIAAPENANDAHIHVLESLATMMLDDDFREKLAEAETSEQFCAMIARRESTGPLKSEPLQEAPPPAPPLYRVLAVTACPAGLAHTYLAAEALQKAAQDQGVLLKVETNGASGVGNELMNDEIAAADSIIIAADKSVPMSRFVGKRLLAVSAGEAIRDPDGVLRRAMDSRLPLYRGGNAMRRSDWKELLREGYRHIMNGVSHMIPFVVGGGVLIALSLLLKQLGAPEVYVNMVDDIGDTAFTLIYPVLAAFVAYSIGDLPAFMPGLAGGYLAQLGMTTAIKLSWVSSGFWGALIAGFAAGGLVRLLAWVGKKLPNGLAQIRDSLLIPVLSLLAVGALMVLVVNPPLGRFNQRLYAILSSMQGGSRLMMGMILGGLMATDYGGPINKAAYLTGTLALVNAQYDIMAATMIGGMVPPIGVAFACLLFPSRFTAEERRTVPQNLVMGASFVTEGALPFALRDPLRVGPSCVAGSALAGVLSVCFGCAVPAPHGGLFLIAVTTNPLGYLIALAAGALLTACLLGILKKPLK